MFLIPWQVKAEDETQPTQITIVDTETPLALKKRNTQATYLVSIASFTLVFIGSYLYVKQHTNKQKLKLEVTDVKDNGDGSYVVSVGFKEPIEKLVNISNVDINVKQGCTIVLKRINQNFIGPGDNKDVFVTIINDRSEIQCRIDNQFVDIKGIDIQKGLINHEKS